MSDPDDHDRLYALLPSIHRLRDADRGYALRGLMRLVGREAQVVEDDLWALYDSWFIETCQDWAVPYIGDLVGFEGAPEAGDPTSLDVSDPRSRLKVLVPRRDVANTVRARRRKGTLAVLEELARDSAGWPARAVEFFRWLVAAQHVNHLRLQPDATVDLRDGRALEDLDSPFDRLAHLVDVRRPNSTLTPGRYNSPAAAVFAWRLRAFTVTHCEADCREGYGREYYAWSALGNDTQLYNVPRPDPATAISEPLELPLPITRRRLEERLPEDPRRRPPIRSIASADYYGLDRSLAIWVPDWPEPGAPQPVPRERIVPADLRMWRYVTPPDHIAVDPECGRFAFPAHQLPPDTVHVSYAYGFSAPIGGGEYERRVRQPHDAVVYRVGRTAPGADDSIAAALRRWQETEPRPKSAVVEILDSEVYPEPFRIALEAGEALQLRAASFARPIIRLGDFTPGPDALKVRGKRGSSLTLVGLLVHGRGLAVEGPNTRDTAAQDDDLCEVVIRHCTLVPGWTLEQDCEPVRPTEASILMAGSHAHLQIEHSIVGSIAVAGCGIAAEPLRIDVADSVLDATDSDCDRPECQALTAADAVVARAVASFRRCTVFGRLRLHAVELAENSIFTGLVRVARTQVGCMRYCAVVPGSRTPRRHRCVEDVRPHFRSTRYGTPGYARLADDAPVEIREGADDQSEMGVFHDLYEPQRAALLRRRLEEFTPAGMDTGLLWAD